MGEKMQSHMARVVVGIISGVIPMFNNFAW
jgi:hypothetical protein